MEWRVDVKESESSNQPAHGSGSEALSANEKKEKKKKSLGI